MSKFVSLSAAFVNWQKAFMGTEQICKFSTLLANTSDQNAPGQLGSKSFFFSRRLEPSDCHATLLITLLHVHSVLLIPCPQEKKLRDQVVSVFSKHNALTT